MEFVFYLKSKGKRISNLEHMQGPLSNLLIASINEPSIEFLSEEFLKDFYFLFPFQERYTYFLNVNRSNFQNHHGFGNQKLRVVVNRESLVGDGLSVFEDMISNFIIIKLFD